MAFRPRILTLSASDFDPGQTGFSTSPHSAPERQTTASFAALHVRERQGDQDERFDVTGYRNRQFTWTHARIAALISAQWAARPQGPHCENTKIWPFCLSAAGLGLKLFVALLCTPVPAP